jgi:dihydrolipoamide dehydrogenase
VSVGRRCDLTALFAESVGIVLNRGRAVVDQNMESNIPHIYVIGDCADGYTQLAHAASAQAMTCAGAITGNPSKTDLTLVPACVYTQPEIASVGYSEAEAKEAGLTAVSGKCTTLGNAKSVITNAGRGFIKIVADENGVIVGAQMMCPRATDMIGEFATAIAAHLTLEQLNTVIHPHPTFEESVAEAVRACKEKWEKRNPR